ncbi:Cytochrome b [hydrothermal vent metagenome]|uniref:Cytochrome b n=1 Tax=hydrothermal vent metagenome TaxID=652676 RepID=A0A3B1A9C8_9ZZZZ
MHTDDVKVWDIVVRLFHWTLVGTFLICFITEDSSRLHIYSGYLIIVLISFRFIWGFIGSKYARFKDFIVAPAIIIQYLKDIVKNKNKRYLGHNPAGAAMIVALITSITITCVSGVILYAVDDHSGPLAFLFNGEHEYLENILEEVHEFFSNFSVILIVFHVLGVIVAGKQHNENLIKSMINGYKKRNSSPQHHN